MACLMQKRDDPHCLLPAARTRSAIGKVFGLSANPFIVPEPQLIRYAGEAVRVVVTLLIATEAHASFSLEAMQSVKIVRWVRHCDEKHQPTDRATPRSLRAACAHLAFRHLSLRISNHPNHANDYTQTS